VNPAASAEDSRATTTTSKRPRAIRIGYVKPFDEKTNKKERVAKK
jgi:hypothetical protein